MKAKPLTKRYYRTLGLSGDASADEIREAYYRLAFTHHPDRNPGDAYAAARFKEVQVAYEWLSQHWAGPPRPGAEQSPFHAPELSQAGSAWQWLAAFALVAAVVVTLTLILRVKPRSVSSRAIQSPALEQHHNPSHLLPKPGQPTELENRELITVRSSLMPKSRPNKYPLKQSSVGAYECPIEDSVESVLKSVQWKSPGSFAAALDAAVDAVWKHPTSSEGLSSEGLAEAWDISPRWPGAASRGLRPSSLPITETDSDGRTQPTLQKVDQHSQIEDKSIRSDSLRRELTSLEAKASEGQSPSEQSAELERGPAHRPEKRRRSTASSIPEFAFSGLQSTAMPLEPSPGNTDKWWNVEPESLFIQQPPQMVHSSSTKYYSGAGGDALQLLGSATTQTNRDDVSPASLNPLERSIPNVTKAAEMALPLFPAQPRASSSRQIEKPAVPWSLSESQQGSRLIDRSLSTTTAESRSWETNLDHKAWPVRAIATEDNWAKSGMISQNGVRGVENELSFEKMRGAMPAYSANVQHAFATSPNYVSPPIRAEVSGRTSYLTPTVRKGSEFSGTYLSPLATPGNRPGATPPIQRTVVAPFDSLVTPPTPLIRNTGK